MRLEVIIIKNLLKNKYNQSDENIPKYILLFMACYVIWQMSIIYLDASNYIIASASAINKNFISNLSSVCAFISILTIVTMIIKPNYCYKLCKISSIISLITTSLLLTNNHIDLYLTVLVGTCSVMSITSLVIYFYTYNSKNLKKQIMMEMFGVGIISLLLHNSLFKINFTLYNIISIILLTLFIIGLFKITEIKILIKKEQKKESNKIFYTGIIIINIIFNLVSTFGSNIVSQTKYGITMFFIGHLVGTILYYILNKSNIKKAYIPSIYVAIFIVSLTLIYLTNINIYTSFLLGASNTMYFAITYYSNLTYKNTLSNTVYIISNVVGVLQILAMDYLLNITHNDLNALVTIYVSISILSFAILTIINRELNTKIDNMLKLEARDNVFISLSETEKMVADLVLKGYSNNEIAKTIYLSLNTVKFHLKNIFKKLNITSRKELINLIN